MDLKEELQELAKQTREHLQTAHKDFVPSTQETCDYFKVKNQVQASPYPFKPYEPSNPDEPPKITPKPTLPPIQRPLPPPIRKLPTPPPQTPAEPPKKKSENQQISGFVLEPLPDVQQVDFNDLKALYTQRFPHNSVLEEPLEDSEAHQTGKSGDSNAYPEVVLLSFSANPKISTFLQNLARAIHVRWKLKANVIAAYQWEQEKAWDGLLSNGGTRLILASDYGLQMLPELMKHYKESPRQGQHFLGSKPLLLLSDITVYLREPHLKQPLWQAICTQFKT